MRDSLKKGEKIRKKEKVSEFWFWLIYSVPLSFVLWSFPYKDPVFLQNPYPFKASFSGAQLQFEVGFTPIPAGIPAYSKPPLLSAIGIPKDLFLYQKCFYHISFFEINNKRVNSDSVTLDVRVKIGSQTTHLAANSRLCLDHDNKDFIEIYAGDATWDGNKVAKLLEQNGRLPIEGRSEVFIKEIPVYSKFAIFIGSLFSFYGLWWAFIIAARTVHQYTKIKNL
jgi:hypothetical protein